MWFHLMLLAAWGQGIIKIELASEYIFNLRVYFCWDMAAKQNIRLICSHVENLVDSLSKLLVKTTFLHIECQEDSDCCGALSHGRPGSPCWRCPTYCQWTGINFPHLSTLRLPKGLLFQLYPCRTYQNLVSLLLPSSPLSLTGVTSMCQHTIYHNGMINPTTPSKSFEIDVTWPICHQLIPPTLCLWGLLLVCTHSVMLTDWLRFSCLATFFTDMVSKYKQCFSWMRGSCQKALLELLAGWCSRHCFGVLSRSLIFVSLC